MNSTIIHSSGFSNKKKSADHEVIASLAGVKLVRLRHWMGFHEFARSMKGFQGGKIELMASRKNGKRYVWAPHKNRFGDDVSTPTPLVFEPDETSEQLLAVMPVTDYNKTFLARIYGMPHAPAILDTELDAEIKVLSLKVKGETERKKSQSELIADQAAEIEKLKKDAAKTEKAGKTVAKRQNILADAQKETQAKATLEAVTAIKESIAEEVYSEKEGLVSALIEKYGDDWESSDEYKEGIASEVEKRLEVKLKEKGISKDEND